MAKTSANPLLNSLKGKIWLATIIFALVIIIYRIVTYVIISLIVDDPLYTVFLPFFFVALGVVVFGWWLSNEVIKPIEKVSLLARSFERGFPTSAPKTSGSIETDELLQTLYRISQQSHKLVSSMDEVANGNLDVVFSSNASSDRVSQSFQKLLAKVSESIHAKQDLEKLQAAITKLSEEVAPIKLGNLETKIKTDAPETKEISLALSYLIEQLGELVAQVKTGSTQTQASAFDFQKMIRGIIQQDENRIQEMNQASVTLKQVPNIIHRISEELSQSSLSAGQSIEKAQRGTQTAQENLNAVGSLRRQIQEAIKRIQRLNERSQEINKVAKTVEDLAHRTSMVALNASIQANQLGEAGRGFVVVSEEVERLAERAGNTNKHISSLNKTIQAEIGEVENSLNATVGEAAKLSKFAIETGDALGELERYVAGVLNLQNKIASYAREQTDDTEKAFQVFVEGISETKSSLANLRESVASVVKISALMEDMKASVEEFKISNNNPEAGASKAFPNYPLPLDADTSA